MKKIGETTVYVLFNFGSFVYVGVTLYEGKTFEECLKLRSNKIESYFKDGEWIDIQRIVNDDYKCTVGYLQDLTDMG